MEEDIKILEDETNALGLFFKCKGAEVYKRALENLLTRYKQLKEENEIYKEELKKIDKALNLEEGTAAPYRNEIIESLKRGIETLKEIIDNSIPKSKVKEIIEWWKKEGYVYGLEKLLNKLQKLL